MYTHFFKLTHNPFSIAPDPRFLYMSERHREALAHLLYGVNGGGGFVLLTGEIGAGKTTVCRCFLEQVPENCNAAYIFNPKLTIDELLRSICEEFRVDLPSEGGAPIGIKTYVDALNSFLLFAHAHGRHNVLIIDEAQGLSADVLEQLRLLTNLETSERKLLQVILIGQPELRTLLEKPELRQLAQRVIARYHLDSLSSSESGNYVAHRLAVAGIDALTPLPRRLIKPIHHITQGIPRRINLLCDRALLGAYAEGKHTVNRRILGKAAQEVFGHARPTLIDPQQWRSSAFGMLAGTVFAAAVWAIVTPSHPSDSTLRNRNAFGSATANPAVRPIAQAPSAIAASSVPEVENDLPLATSNALPNFDPNDIPENSSTNAQRAYRQLALHWGQSLGEGDACALLRQADLRCYQSHKGFAEIRQLNRPAILSLQTPAGHPYYALLTGLTETQAILQIGDMAYATKIVRLMPYFRGDFATLWKVPPAYREEIHSGDQGKDIDWIALQLAKLYGKPFADAESSYDEAMMRQIREFQSAQGLTSDGVAGPKTMMQLNRAAGGAEPRLLGSSIIAQNSPRK